MSYFDLQATGLEYGKVSSTELVQAVHDMLSAAGVRMDATKETLLQTTLSLQDHLKESQVALLVEQVCPLRYLLGLFYIHFYCQHQEYVLISSVYHKRVVVTRNL